MLSYILDTREKQLQALLNKANIKYEIKQLDLGDIIINYKNVPADEPVDENERLLLGLQPLTDVVETTLIIERKTYTDLKASLADGRYHEQKQRYLTLKQGIVYYILEQNDPAFKELDYKQYLGCYVHTVLRDNINVFHSSSMEETVSLILKMGTTLQEMKGIVNNQVAVKSTQLKKKKPKGEEIYILQLCCIPGISSAKAKAIANIYGNISSLIEALRTQTLHVPKIGPKLLTILQDVFIC